MSRYDEAEPLLRRALAMRGRVVGSEPADTRATRDALVALLRATGRGAEATELAAARPGPD